MEVKFFKDGVEIDPKEIRAAEILDLAKFLLDSSSLDVLKTAVKITELAGDVQPFILTRREIEEGMRELIE